MPHMAITSVANTFNLLPFINEAALLRRVFSGNCSVCLVCTIVELLQEGAEDTIISTIVFELISMSMSIKFLCVAKIAELGLLRSPQGRSRVTIQNQEMIAEKEMLLGVDGKQVGMEMTECQLAVSSIGVMQQLERSVDRRL